MTESVTIACSIPTTWQAKIEQLAAARNRSSEQILYEAIAQYLGESVETVGDRFSILETEVATLQSSVSTLNSTVQTLQQRLLSAASILSLPETSIPIQPKNQAMPLLEDELEDEPDEVLYDFLEPGGRISS